MSQAAAGKISSASDKNSLSGGYLTDRILRSLSCTSGTMQQQEVPSCSKQFSREEKRAAIELWKVKVPLTKIRQQLDMNERTLRRILRFAEANPDAPVGERKEGSGRPSKFSRTFKEKMKKTLTTN